MDEPSELRPKNTDGYLDTAFVNVPSTAEGLDTGAIFQYVRNNEFRTGQKLLLYLGIETPVAADGNFLTEVQLKPWWARANQEFRQAYGGNGQPGNGGGTGLPIDRLVFGAGSVVGQGLSDNRYVWLPSPKINLVSEYAAAPPTPALAGHVNSHYVDDVWTFALPDPSTISAKFGAGQSASRWIPIPYTAYGYALGFTFARTYDDPDGDPVAVNINLTWISLGYDGVPRISPSQFIE